jgi:hypothetical protein
LYIPLRGTGRPLENVLLLGAPLRLFMTPSSLYIFRPGRDINWSKQHTRNPVGVATGMHSPCDFTAGKRLHITSV